MEEFPPNSCKQVEETEPVCPFRGKASDWAQIKQLLHVLFETDDLTPAVAEDFYAIRPSGNPLTAAEYRLMRMSPDLIFSAQNIWRIEEVKYIAGGLVCIVVLKVHEIFSYKGKQNDDIATFMAVLEKQNGKWLGVRAQRSIGANPATSGPKVPF